MIKTFRLLIALSLALGFMVIGVGEAFAAPCTYTKSSITSMTYTAREGAVGGILPATGPTATRTFNDQTGNVKQNDVLAVSFTLASECVDMEVSFATYKTLEPYWNAATADQQRLHNSATGFFTGTGPHTLEIHVAECYFQTDFAVGPVIQRLGEDGLYGTRNKDSDLGGTWQCHNLDGNNDSDPSEEVGEAERPPVGTWERVCFEQTPGIIVCGWQQPF